MSDPTYRRGSQLNRKSLAVATIALSLGLSACSAGATGSGESGTTAPGAPSEGAEHILSISEMDPEDSVNGAAWKEFVEYIEEATAGRITFETYFSSSLMPGEEVLSGVGTGTADIGRIIAAYYPGELPVANWALNLGGLAAGSFPAGFVQGMMTTNDVYVADGELKSELIENNLYPLLANVPSQQYDMLCTEPIESLAQASGKQVRTPGGLWSREIEELGMLPISMPMGEVYEGLQRGVIDCAVVQVPAYIDFALWEVAKHYVPVKLSQQNGNMLVINNDVWESLSDDDKIVFEEASVIFNEIFLNRTIDRYRQFSMEGPDEYGLVFADPTELNEVITEFQEARVEDMMASAPASLENPQQFVDSYLEVLDGWLATAEDLGLDVDDVVAPQDIRSAYMDAPDVSLAN